MTERQMQTLFRDYIAKNPPEETEVYELKIEKGNRLSFSAVKPHQISALLKVQEGSLFYKITDQPWGYNPKFRFTAQKPFDCMSLVKVKAFIVVWFFKPRQHKIFYKIPILDFIKLEQQSSMKSFTESEAKIIGEALSI